MDISSVNSDLIRGNVTTIILGSLWNEDRYGYDIMKEIESKSDGQYSLKQATLYNQLKRLEKQGLISSYDGAPDDTGGGKRRYYALTPEGKKYLQKEKAEYEYSRTILDKLVSANEFDFTRPIPFDASELRPYAKRDPEDKPKVVYKDKIVERAVYYDRFGNEITQEQAMQLAQQALEQQQDAKLEQQAQQKRFEDSLRLQKQYHEEEIQELQLKNEQAQLENEQKLSEAELQIQSTVQKWQDEVEARERAEQKLREIEEENQRKEQERLLAEEEARRIAELEAQRKREQQQRPSLTLAEMFAKLDAESEYTAQKEEEEQPIYTPLAAQPQEHTYINAYSGEVETAPRAQSSLRDIFRRLDEREAEIDSQMASKTPPEPQTVEDEVLDSELISQNSVQKNYDESTMATAAVITKPEDSFAYENENVDYREFFYSVAEQPTQPIKQEPEPQSMDVDIKTRLYTKGFKIRPYDRGNTSEYYTFNFLLSNRIRRDAFLIVLALFVLEVAIMWVSLANRISYVYFLPILIGGICVCIAPTFVYLSNPMRRIRANFNFKLSLLNRAMLWIELSVVCILIGFFGAGISVNDLNGILCAIVLPIILLFNIPISSVVYWLLYRTRKYHIA